MKRRTLAVLATTIVAVAVTAASLQSAMTNSSKQIAHGKYIVHQVSMCIDCHGPNLKGGPLPFKSAVPDLVLMPQAPDIRGSALTTYTQADLAKAMMTGKRPSGGDFLPPMPHFKMNATDAGAVAAYLKSLK